MSSIGLFLAGGVAFLIGAVLVGLACGTTLLPPHRTVLGARVALASVGLAFVLLSTTPTNPWLFGLWLVLVVASLSSRIDKVLSREGARLVRATGALLALVVFCTELSHHWLPSLPRAPVEKLYVIGDSISAGTAGDELETWPTLLDQQTEAEVVNLSVPGATLASAVHQARQLGNERAVVIVEVGGNDILASRPAETFERDLERLLREVCRRQQTVVMLELPLPVLHHRHGASQRRLAARFGVTLIPRRFFAGILGGRGATIDGLHLSALGHQQMAALVRSVVHSAGVAGP